MVDHHRHASENHLMAFRWHSVDGPIIVVFRFLLPQSKNKKQTNKQTKRFQAFLDPRMCIFIQTFYKRLMLTYPARQEVQLWPESSYACMFCKCK